MCSSTFIQRQYAEQMGLNTSSVDLLTQIIQRMAEEISRAFEMQNNIVQTFLETSRQNIKRLNENTTMYTEWQKKFIDFNMNNVQKTK